MSIAKMNCLTVKLKALQLYFDQIHSVFAGPYVVPEKLDKVS